MQFYSVTNWEKFQHYKQRNPPWIKLYRKLMSKYEFEPLSIHERYMLIGLWLYRAEKDDQCLEIDGDKWVEINHEKICHFIKIPPQEIPFEKFAELGFIVLRGDECDQDHGKDKEKKPRKKSAANPDVKTFIDWYHDRHLDRTGTKLVVDGAKDAANVKRVLGSLSIDDLKERAERFLNDDNSWPKGDKSLRFFCQNVNRYASESPSNHDNCPFDVEEEDQ